MNATRAEPRRRLSANQRLLVLAGGLLLLTGAMRLLCGASSGALGFFRALALCLSALWGGLWGLVPTPLSEILLILAVVCGPMLLIVYLVRRRGAGLKRLLCALCAAAGSLLLTFQLLFGVHYQAPSLASQLGFSVREYTVDELRDTTAWLAEQVSALAPNVPRGQDGVCDFGSFDEQIQAVALAYDALAAQYPVFDTPTRSVRPKPARLLSVVMSYLGITGYYFPFTAEPVVSIDNVQTHLPSTIAHEWAHARGIGPEAECNFTAFLACTASEDVRVRYSGYLTAYIYASNALYTYSYEEAQEISAALHEQAKGDIRTLNAHWAQYETPVQEVGEAVNNAYIRATGQPDGVRSYGQMVDLLISYRLAS